MIEVQQEAVAVLRLFMDVAEDKKNVKMYEMNMLINVNNLYIIEEFEIKK